MNIYKYLLLICVLHFHFVWAVEKYQVCSITINSSDEIELFKQYLGKQDFEFVELVPPAKTMPNNTHWFLDACQRGYRCDVVVISGHFGGLFFGKKHNYILPVDMMERESCSHSCKGILHHAKEVFLFGCNTLADKQKDHRTPEQYARILIDDYHMVTDMAQMVAAAKYLPFSLSFEEQMRIVFSNPNTSIYGFNSLSPVGSKIRQTLSNYLHGIQLHYGSYRSYLDKKRPEGLNPILHRTIGGSIKEVNGLKPGSEIFNIAQKICPLYSNHLSNAEGMRKIEQLLDEGDGLAAYTAIKRFIATRSPFNGESLNIFNRISDNVEFEDMFASIYESINSLLPYIKVQFLKFLYDFNWVEEMVYNREMRRYTLNMAQKSNSEAYDFISALAYDEKISFQHLGFTSEDFSKSFYHNIWSALILEALNVQDYRVHRHLMNLCLSQVTQDPVICYQVMKSLGHLNVSDALVVDRMVEFLKSKPPHYGLIWYAIYGLSYAHIKDVEIHRTIAKHIYYPPEKQNDKTRWVQLQAVRSLAFLKVQDQKIGEWLAYTLHTSMDEEIVLETLKALYQMKHPPFQKIRKAIQERKLRQSDNKVIRHYAHCFYGAC